MRSLDAAMIGNVVVQIPGAAGATVSALLTTPPTMRTWGETEVDKLFEERTTAYDPKTDVAEGPIVLAAASERKEANWPAPGRLVLFGGLEWARSDLLRLPDPELLKKGVVASRFPGNLELFTNSVFWLSKMDTMIAISPSAMEVSRIRGDMSKGAEGFWRIGVVLIGMPLAVVVAGTLVYLGRRD